MLWYQEILFGLVTGGWVQRAETLHFALSHRTGEDLPSHRVLSLAIRENFLSSHSLSDPCSALPSIFHRRLIWNTIWELTSDFHSTYITSQTKRVPLPLALPMEIPRPHPGAASLPLIFPPEQLLVSTARTCILSAPSPSTHPSPSSTLPSKSVLLSRLLPHFPRLSLWIITAIPSSVLGILQAPPFSCPA